MTAVRVKLGTNGRLVIPANLRREAGLGEGKTVLIETSADGLRIRPMEDVVMQAQKKLQKYLILQRLVSFHGAQRYTF